MLGAALGPALHQSYNLNYLTEDGEMGETISICELDAVDTVSICSGEEVMLFAEGAIVEDHDWTWSPADWLTTTEGDTTYASPSETITYTVTPSVLDVIV